MFDGSARGIVVTTIVISGSGIFGVGVRGPTEGKVSEVQCADKREISSFDQNSVVIR